MLDKLFSLNKNTARRIGVDAEDDEFVVFDKTSDGVFHGHVRPWEGLTDQMQRLLIRAGKVTSKGKIIR